jgi:hypothetical protein
VIATFRASHPGILVCAACEQADIVHDLALARRTTAILACADPGPALDAGLPAGRLLVEVPPARLPQASAAGYATLVELADGPGAGPTAIAAICGWLGATVVRTAHPLRIRLALDMAESIRGLRLPARTVRGLG